MHFASHSKYVIIVILNVCRCCTMSCFRSVLCCLLVLCCSAVHADVNSFFNQINKNPNALYAFFKSMPKGGELHYHLWGGVYPETLLEFAAKGDYCINKKTYEISKASQHCYGVKSSDVNKQPDVYAKVIKNWSLKDFVARKTSAFDHFFNIFNKNGILITDYGPQILAKIIQGAAEQREQYLEIMILPDNGNSIRFGSLIKSINSFSEKKDKLINNKDFLDNISFAVFDPERILRQTRQELGCDILPQSPSCLVQVRFQFYVLREQPLDSIFAQALTAFETASRSNGVVVGVNIVQPENGINTLSDYRKQMEIFNYLHSLYPKVNIALHAGELAPESVAPKDMSFHIHDAVFTAHAQRIGHGVDIGFENNAETTLNYMAKQQIPVEINLTSNEKLLNVSGNKHPLNYYLAHNVPVTLSTDDEGIFRTDLTRQYVDAVLGHGLNYQTIKQINRNALTYAFMPGESIWVNPANAELIAECQDLNSNSCRDFVKNSEKARLQWQLEKELMDFEQEF